MDNIIHAIRLPNSGVNNSFFTGRDESPFTPQDTTKDKPISIIVTRTIFLSRKSDVNMVNKKEYAQNSLLGIIYKIKLNCINILILTSAPFSFIYFYNFIPMPHIAPLYTFTKNICIFRFLYTNFTIQKFYSQSTRKINQ